MLEMAFLIPILLGLLVGAIELGRFAYLGILVGNAARAGVGYASQSLPQSVDTAGICDAASQDFNANACSGGTSTGTNGSITISSSTSCGCDSGGTITSAACTGTTAGTCGGGAHWAVMVTVNTSGTFTSLFSFPGIPGSITLARSSTMRVAQQ